MLRQTGVCRRDFLAGSLSLGAFLFPHAPTLARPSSQRAPRNASRAKSVIVLLQEGGMSHLESWDPKPDAPDEVRGSFSTIPTANPALTVGQHMPLLAQQAKLFNVVRSVYMDNARRDHSPVYSGRPKDKARGFIRRRAPLGQANTLRMVGMADHRDRVGNRRRDPSV